MCAVATVADRFTILFDFIFLYFTYKTFNVSIYDGVDSFIPTLWRVLLISCSGSVAIFHKEY